MINLRSKASVRPQPRQVVWVAVFAGLASLLAGCEGDEAPKGCLGGRPCPGMPQAPPPPGVQDEQQYGEPGDDSRQYITSPGQPFGAPIAPSGQVDKQEDVEESVYKEEEGLATEGPSTGLQLHTCDLKSLQEEAVKTIYDLGLEGVPEGATLSEGYKKQIAETDFKTTAACCGNHKHWIGKFIKMLTDHAAIFRKVGVLGKPGGKTPGVMGAIKQLVKTEGRDEKFHAFLKVWNEFATQIPAVAEFLYCRRGKITRPGRDGSEPTVIEAPECVPPHGAKFKLGGAWAEETCNTLNRCQSLIGGMRSEKHFPDLTKTMAAAGCDQFQKPGAALLDLSPVDVGQAMHVLPSGDVDHVVEPVDHVVEPVATVARRVEHTDHAPSRR